MRFSFREQRFIDSVSKVVTEGAALGVDGEIAEALYPVLLCAAAGRGDVEGLERMIAAGADLDAGDYDGRTPLHLAAAEGHLDIVRYLISARADINAIDRWGRTPLRDAELQGHDDVVRFLKARGGKSELPDDTVSSMSIDLAPTDD